MALADRFHTAPWDVAALPAAVRAWYLGLLFVEGEVAEAWEGLGPNDTVTYTDDD